MKLKDLTRRDMERLEREAYTRDFATSRHNASAPDDTTAAPFPDDLFDPWHGRSLAAAKAQERT